MAVASIGQPTPVFPATVVVVTPLPPLNTQLGNCVHEPLLKQVTLRLPPVFIYPLAQAKTMYEFTNMEFVSCEEAIKFF